MTRGYEDDGCPTAARSYIPRSHRALPMLRLYLPFRDPSLPTGDDVVRWSRFVDVEEQPASLSWFEVADRVAEEKPEVRDLVASMGVLDDDTAQALRDAIGDRALRCLRWVGYAGETPFTDAPVRVHGEDYFEADLTPDDVRAEHRIPEFAWDADGCLAWGALLYPDSLVIAAELPLFRQLRNDPRVDTATLRPDRDAMPPSAGD
ncbi:hypothetical protein [Microbacterium hibisci]|uniref:hypothetical protein n=1 Tax=Microbacterium hibisci TaxID=2036000 RepID=UPI00194370B8|nr:hypothetical protein [Microbacterium hibisci]